MSKFYRVLEKYVFRPAVYTAAGTTMLLGINGRTDVAQGEAESNPNPVSIVPFDKWGPIYLEKARGRTLNLLDVSDFDMDGDNDIILKLRKGDVTDYVILQNEMGDDVNDNHIYNYSNASVLSSTVEAIGKLETSNTTKFKFSDIDKDGDNDAAIYYQSRKSLGVLTMENIINE